MMEKRPRYFFKKDMKNEFLRGMKMTYIADKVGISYSYLYSIIQAQNVVDDYLIARIMLCIGYKNTDIKNLKSKFFELRENHKNREG